MAAVYNGNIFRRKGLSDDAAENSGGIAGFGTGLDDCCIAPGNACCQRPKREQKGKVERTDNQCLTIRKLIDAGDQAGKADQTAEMHLRPCPAAQTMEDFIDFQNNGAHITEIAFRRVSAQILFERFGQFLFMSDHGLAEFSEHFHAERDGKGFSGLKECFLTDEKIMDFCFCPAHISSSMQSLGKNEKHSARSDRQKEGIRCHIPVRREFLVTIVYHTGAEPVEKGCLRTLPSCWRIW